MSRGLTASLRLLAGGVGLAVGLLATGCEDSCSDLQVVCDTCLDPGQRASCETAVETGDNDSCTRDLESFQDVCQ